MKKYAWGLVTLLCCLGGFYLRWLNAHADLASPWVDENDVVQQGVAFMGGEWRYYLLEYGALPMYCLAALYRLVALLRGLTPLDYAARVFYDGPEHYLIARLFCAACYVPLSIASYRFLAPRFGRSAGLVSACLLALPCVDPLTRGTVRIDVPQGACQLGAVLFLAKALESQGWRHWLWAGLWAGLGVACKPLPGLLIAPCFLAASWLASAGAPEPATGMKAVLRALALRVWRTVSRPALWASGAIALGAAVLANPTSLDLRTFIAGQIEATGYYSGPKAPGVHLTPFQALEPLSMPFLIAAAVSLLLMPFVRDARARLIALFPLVYGTAFWGRPVRLYYMVSPAMALCLVIGVCVGLALRRLGLDAPLQQPERASSPASEAPRRASRRMSLLSCAACLALVTLLSWRPLTWLDEYRRAITGPTLAREWIHQNVPSGTRLFQYGTFADGPRLVAASWQEESQWADFFDYGRQNYRFYGTAARKAYDDYRNQGRPWYEIDAYRQHPEGAKSNHRTWLTQRLAQRAAKQHQQYIILANFRGDDYRQLGYSWFADVELTHQGGRIAVFRVPQLPLEVPSQSPSVTVPSAAPAGEPGQTVAGTNGNGG